MKPRILVGSVCLLALASCGLEGMVSNVKRRAYDRPASTVSGSVSWNGATLDQLSVVDGDGNAIGPFFEELIGKSYQLQLPSSKYSFVRAQGRGGNFWLRALVPDLGEETTVTGVDLDARRVTEALIVEARLSADQKTFKQLTPAAYVGDGVTTGTRTLIYQAFDAESPTTVQRATQDLLCMVQRFVDRASPSSGETDLFFGPSQLTTSYVVTRSPIDSVNYPRNPFPYDCSVSGVQPSTAAFDAKLGEVASHYDPSGCPDPVSIRVILAVDFNPGAQDGNCMTVNRFKWVTDKPGKKMFFTGALHQTSPIQSGEITRMLGQFIPNQIPMYDDGTNGDEVAGDNIWTISFDLPRGARIAYKYTWGKRGDNWTGSEEWPGNQRLLEIVDVNGDRFVSRHDVFGDEATNKDFSNLNLAGTGVVDFTTDLHGCGPEAHEKPYTPHTMCQCNVPWVTPQAVGPLTIACGP